jgi:deoxyribodipyrimidine photolyase-related protein
MFAIIWKLSRCNDAKRMVVVSFKTFIFNECKMISPQEVIDRCIEEWQKRPNEIEYNQLEGFVRQIIGWREYMRGIYWNKMPEFATLNFFNNQEKLPDWFWTGNTKMNCLKDA